MPDNNDTPRTSRVPARVFDNSDGTYTVAVYFLQPGQYKLWAWLWYSDCHGYQVWDLTYVCFCPTHVSAILAACAPANCLINPLPYANRSFLCCHFLQEPVESLDYIFRCGSMREYSGMGKELHGYLLMQVLCILMHTFVHPTVAMRSTLGG